MPNPRFSAALVFLFAGTAGFAQTPPVISSWRINPGGVTGYGGQTANVQTVRYSANYVYVGSAGIPDFTIGPWPSNPNTAGTQNYTFKIPRNPAPQTGTHTATPLGSMAVLVNGVVLYNALDARSYNNQNIWHSNAVVVEAISFDAVLGHPDMGSRYHHHQNPVGLHSVNGGAHSPLLGYAWDGYPIYGPYGFSAADGSGGARRIRSSYQKRAITQRHILPNGTVLSAAQWGPDVSATYPLGYYAEDFLYVAGLGDLDTYNGRFAVTPEYPSGTYAYHVTIDATGASEYPYVIGPTYYGVVATENTSTGGHVTVSEAVTSYTAPAGLGQVPGSLIVAKSGGNLQVSWNLGCSSNATDYAVYQGTLGSWYSHAALTCAAPNRYLKYSFTPASGSAYYLVVPVNANSEGSYGLTGAGSEIPGAALACHVARQLGGCS